MYLFDNFTSNAEQISKEYRFPIKTQDIIIAHPKTAQQVNALKAFMEALKIQFEVSKDNPYNPDFVAKIEKSRQDYKEGNFVTVEKEGLSAFLGLE